MLYILVYGLDSISNPTVSHMNTSSFLLRSFQSEVIKYGDAIIASRGHELDLQLSPPKHVFPNAPLSSFGCVDTFIDNTYEHGFVELGVTRVLSGSAIEIVGADQRST